MPAVHFETLGCRLNQIETEGAADFFRQDGFDISMKPVSAAAAARGDVVLCVLNTCAVTTKAEQKGRRVIRLLLQKFPSSIILVTGCYAQLSGGEIEGIDGRIIALPGLLKSRIKSVPQFIKEFIIRKNFSGTAEIMLLKSALKEFLSTEAGESAENAFVFAPESFATHSRASLKVQDGCNNACSYCAIHLARGKSVSIDARTAVERAVALENGGYNELILTGVNIGQYSGIMDGKRIGIAGLLQAILDSTKRIAVRFSSIYPETVTDEFCRVIQNPRVRPHFHLSVQSGSDKILAAMKRPYKRAAVLESCRRLRLAKENPFLACDIITGFPGETDADFSDTLNLVEEAGFAAVHAFPFSPRRGTAAFSMRPKIPERVKDERAAVLNEYSSRAKAAYAEKWSGRVVEGIAETSHSGKSAANLVTENFIHCRILLNDGEHAPKEGSVVRVKILGADAAAVSAREEWYALSELAQ